MRCMTVPCQAGARSHPAKCQRAAIGLQQIVLSLGSGWWDEWQPGDSPVLHKAERPRVPTIAFPCKPIMVAGHGSQRVAGEKELKIVVWKTWQYPGCNQMETEEKGHNKKTLRKKPLPLSPKHLCHLNLMWFCKAEVQGFKLRMKPQLHLLLPPRTERWCSVAALAFKCACHWRETPTILKMGPRHGFHAACCIKAY